MIHWKRERCRACDGSDLELVLDLGRQPLANSLLASPTEFERERGFPLELHVCRDCSLAQLVDVIAPEILFGHYLYVSGTSDTMAAHHAAYARDMVREYGLGTQSLVVEIASNDGSLLAHFAREGVQTLGVEPARNIAELAQKRGIDTVCEFFGRAAAQDLLEERGPAACVVANNVLAHVDDTRDLLEGMATLVGDEGVVVVEVPYVRDMVEGLEYDTIYHEHHCYFSVTSLVRLCESAGLAITRVERVPVHGGSLRVHARSLASAGARRGVPASAGGALHALARTEEDIGLTSPARYREFARAVAANKLELRELLADLRAKGKRLAAYGAPAKGSTLLNYCGIGTELVEYTVDKNPLKVGRYTPGMHLPVLPASALVERVPDYVLILAWNFAEEIQRQQATYLDRGGRFLVPLPTPRIL